MLTLQITHEMDFQPGLSILGRVCAPHLAEGPSLAMASATQPHVLQHLKPLLQCLGTMAEAGTGAGKGAGAGTEAAVGDSPLIPMWVLEASVHSWV